MCVKQEVNVPKQPVKIKPDERVIRVRGGVKGVRHITMSEWQLERDQAKGKKPTRNRRT